VVDLCPVSFTSDRCRDQQQPDARSGITSGDDRQNRWAAGRLREEYMSNVVVFENLTLDGVVQAPGGPDEDPRGGFGHGGWADVQVHTLDADPVLARVAAASAVTRLRRGT
jgi:hypothetical protein